MKDLPDNELFALIDRGEADAFSALLDKHYATLLSFAFKYCRSQPDAEDILQESLLKIARSFDLFDRRHKFTTWAYRIIVNTAKDLFKKRQLERKKEQAFADEAACWAAEEADGRQDSIWQLVDRLPEKLYSAVVLVYGQGLSHGEAAAALGCAETTVSWRLHSARKKLLRKAREIGLIILFLLFGGEE